MSRVMIFNLSGNVVGEIHGYCSRAWAINDGAESTMTLPAASVLSGLDLGCLALAEHEKLPAWAGMIDTPWTAKLPVGITIYPCEYLLAIRTPDRPQRLTGSTGAIAKTLLALAGETESLPILAGEIDEDNERTEKIDLKPIWGQLKEIVSRVGMEMRFRPEMEGGRLTIYLDIRKSLGMDTGYLLHDGENANLEIADAVIEGEIINRIIGFGDQQSKESRKYTSPIVDEDSAKHYRLRSGVIQYQGDVSTAQMTDAVQVALAQKSQPRLVLTARALDVGDTFHYLNLGNSLIVHASQLYLPGGVRGWRGSMRIRAMAYAEETNQVDMTLEGTL